MEWQTYWHGVMVMDYFSFTWIVMFKVLSMSNVLKPFSHQCFSCIIVSSLYESKKFNECSGLNEFCVVASIFGYVRLTVNKMCLQNVDLKMKGSWRLPSSKLKWWSQTRDKTWDECKKVLQPHSEMKRTMKMCGRLSRISNIEKAIWGTKYLHLLEKFQFKLQYDRVTLPKKD